MTVARVTKITAASPTEFQAAVAQALSRAAQTLRGISGLEMISQKAKVEDGKVSVPRLRLGVLFHSGLHSRVGKMPGQQISPVI